MALEKLRQTDNSGVALAVFKHYFKRVQTHKSAQQNGLPSDNIHTRFHDSINQTQQNHKLKRSNDINDACVGLCSKLRLKFNQFGVVIHLVGLQVCVIITYVLSRFSVTDSLPLLCTERASVSYMHNQPFLQLARIPRGLLGTVLVKIRKCFCIQYTVNKIIFALIK